jgi:hypothetical protein
MHRSGGTSPSASQRSSPSERPPLTTQQRQAIQKLKTSSVGGIKIVSPVLAVEAAAKANLPLSLACALLDQESGGGHNVWGHDKGTIFAGGYDTLHHRDWGHVVTKQSYTVYKAERGSRGQGGMQGVGPTQLTYYTVQNEADKRGGTWNPLPNMIEGFTILHQNVASQGLRLGVALYNGPPGPKTLAYADEVLRKEREWAAKLGVRSIQAD